MVDYIRLILRLSFHAKVCIWFLIRWWVSSPGWCGYERVLIRTFALPAIIQGQLWRNSNWAEVTREADLRRLNLDGWVSACISKGSVLLLHSVSYLKLKHWLWDTLKVDIHQRYLWLRLSLVFYQQTLLSKLLLLQLHLLLELFIEPILSDSTMLQARMNAFDEVLAYFNQVQRRYLNVAPLFQVLPHWALHKKGLIGVWINCILIDGLLLVRLVFPRIILDCRLGYI